MPVGAGAPTAIRLSPFVTAIYRTDTLYAGQLNSAPPFHKQLFLINKIMFPVDFFQPVINRGQEKDCRVGFLKPTKFVSQFTV